MNTETSKTRIWLFALAVVGGLIPFVVVDFPPITDLPQHIYQSQLILNVLAGDAEGYRLQWFTPYLTTYLIPLILVPLFGAISAASLSLGVVGAFWTAAIHSIARAFDRPAALALLLSIVFFNLCLYWGFLSFLGGFPIFCFLFWFTTRGEERFGSVGRGFVYLGLFALLYFTHALWFAAGCLWLGLHWLLFRRTKRSFFERVIGSAPAVAGALSWYLVLRESNFQSKTNWNFEVHRRFFALDWAGATSFVPMNHVVEWAVFGAVLAWILVSILTRWNDLREEVNLELLTAALIFAIASFALPDFYQNTIGFAYRWVPAAVIFGALALPKPRIPDIALHSFAVVVFLLFVVSTTERWIEFEKVDFSGLDAAVEAVPEGANVMSLAYRNGANTLGRNELYQWRPYLHTGVWLQLKTEGEVNFSFADFVVMPVVYEPSRVKRYTRGLDWNPQGVRQRDFGFFEYALVGGTNQKHAEFLTKYQVEEVTSEGVWRLYKGR